MICQIMNSLESYTEAIGLDLANIWEPLKAYKLDSDLMNLKLQID